MSADSMDPWIARLNQGDVAALDRVFVVYEPYLRMAVRRHLSDRLRTKVDSGDVVQSAFADVIAGVRDRRWTFEGRAQLLGLLRKIARRRLADRYEKHGRALERERPLGDGSREARPDDRQPRPSLVAQGREFWERVLAACPPKHTEVVRLRMEGHRLAEIAERTGLHEGSVRRILYDLARKLAIDGRG